MQDRTFARLSGAGFGGLEVRPLDIIGRMWTKSAGRILSDSGRVTGEIASGRLTFASGVGDVARWHAGWWASLAEDPAWHGRWMGDVARKWLRVCTTARLRDPRVQGPAELRLRAPVLRVHATRR
jgi:hypothetical protein